MKINELVLYNEPGSVEGRFPFVLPDTLKQVVKMNGVYVGVKKMTMPLVSIWNNDPLKNEENLVQIGAAHLDKQKNGFTMIQVPTVKPEFRGKGYGILFYEYSLDVLNLKIQSDDIQTPGSALIWSLLARNPKYKVYGVDKKNKEVPVIPDGKRLFVGDKTVYDNPDIVVLRCIKK